MSHVYPPYYMPPPYYIPPGYYQYPTHWPAYPEPPKAWECPRCRKMHAPHSMVCDCKPSLGSVTGGTVVGGTFASIAGSQSCERAVWPKPNPTNAGGDK